MILKEPLLSRLREKGRIPWSRLDELVKESDSDVARFSELAIRLGYLDRAEAGSIVASSLGRAYLKLADTLFQPEVVELLPCELAIKYRAIPVYKMGSAATVAMADPSDYGTISVIEKAMGCSIETVFSFPDEIDTAIRVNYEAAARVDSLASGIDPEALASLGEDDLVELKPIVAISESLILIALKEKASDVHIEPKRTSCVVRFRVDGMLAKRFEFPAPFVRPLVARYKVMASLDIADSRRPQDGRIAFRTPSKTIDVRVSTLPSLHGEKVVLRILGTLSEDVALNLDRLGISPDVLERLKAMLERPHGIVFVTGPTGSGKSTTLYAAANYVDRPSVNIVTIEDPVEYEVPTITQSPVDVKAGRTFASILRAVLRQDPDVILVGEIRDTETARIATQAALTGHLVLSSLHTNNALQAVLRLVDMGVEPHVVAPAMIGVIGQRLVRKLCASCKTAFRAEEGCLAPHFYWEGPFPAPTLYRPVGCPDCRGTGYSGRVAIHEVFSVTQEVRDLILRGASYAEIRALAYENGFQDMRFDGFRKVFRGLTTIEEVMRVTGGD
ncbi:MAG: GspE/PulE family protein [Planctomycetota bacterium]